MTSKVPPPVGLATKDPVFNRWLLELTSILNSAGQVDPGSVAGLAALTIQVTAQGTAITTLNGEVTTLNGEVATLNGEVATLNGEVATLQANAVVHNGVGAPAAGLGAVNDWYANVGGAVGARIYIKTAPGVWTAFPF